MHTVKPISVSILLTIFSICLGGCSHSKAESKPAATKSALGSVDYHSRIYLLDYDRHITISSDGRIRREGSQAKGKEGVATGHLTTAQVSKLLEMFSGWERVNDNYPGFPDGPEYEITYNGKTVKFGGPAPDAPQLWEIRGELQRMASALKAGE